MSAPESATAASGKESSQSVQLFQRAHQKMVILQRVEEQMQQLLNQRRSIQDELRGIQVQINEEFDRLLRAGGTAAAAAAASVAANGNGTSRLLVDIADDAKRVASREADAVSIGE